MRAPPEDAQLGTLRLERLEDAASLDSLGLAGFEIWTAAALMADMLATMKLGARARDARGMTARATGRVALVELEYLAGKRVTVAHVGEVIANLLRRRARVVLVHESNAQRDIARRLVASATRHLWRSAVRQRLLGGTSMKADLKLFRATVRLLQRGGLRTVPIEVRASTRGEARTIIRTQYGKRVHVVREPAVVR